MNSGHPLDGAADCFDLDHVRELCGLSEPGEPDFFADLAKTYLQSAPPLLDELARSLAEADTTSARAKAHALKGMSGNIGAFALQHAAAVLEEKAKKGTEPLLPSDLNPILSAHRRVEEVLRAFLAEAL